MLEENNPGASGNGYWGRQEREKFLEKRSTRLEASWAAEESQRVEPDWAKWSELNWTEPKEKCFHLKINLCRYQLVYLTLELKQKNYKMICGQRSSKNVQNLLILDWLWESLKFIWLKWWR